MATKSTSGTYARISVNVWFDKAQDAIHITSDDPDIPGNGIHVYVKRGTASDVNLRALLADMGCNVTPLKKGA